jgi:hypothetical protein
MVRGLAIALILALCPAAACGGGGLTASSGIDPDRQVGSLNDTERAALCDWTSSLSGGYGRDIVCSDGQTRPVDDTQQDCLQRFSSFDTCRIEVRVYEACVRHIFATACAPDPVSTPECDVYLGCVSS